MNIEKNNRVESESEKSNLAPYASIALTTAGGFAIGGIYGSAIGFVSGVIDEALIRYNFTDKHYLSMTMFHYSMNFQPWAVKLYSTFPDNKILIDGTSFALAHAYSVQTDDFIDFNKKIDVHMDSFLTLIEVFDDKEIFSSEEACKIANKLIESPADGFTLLRDDLAYVYNNPFLFNFLASGSLDIMHVLVDNLLLRAMGEYAGGMFVTILFKEDSSGFRLPEEDLQIFRLASIAIEALKVISIKAVDLYFDQQVKILERKLSQEHNKIIINKITDILLDEGNSRKILGINKEEGQDSINYLFNDLNQLLESAGKVNNAITSSFGAVVNLGNLISLMPDMIFPYLSLGLLYKQDFQISIIPDLKRIAKDRSKSLIKANKLINDIIDRSEQIDLRDGASYIKYKFNNEWTLIKDLDLESTVIGQAQVSIDNSITIYNHAADTVFLGSRYFNGALDFSILSRIYKAIGGIASFLSSNLQSEAANIEIILSQKRLDKLFKLISSPDIQANHIDSQDGDIIFKNYSLFVGNRTLIKEDYLKFEQGKHYAITGKKGSGKSHLLIDLKLGAVGAFSSYGEITYPLDSKMTFLNQKLYIPKESSLLEVLNFPNILDQLTEESRLDLVQKTIFLLEAFGMEDFIDKLDSQEYHCSGGQEKTLGFIQAILAKPDILILDESFNELDEESIIIIQQAIVKFLPNATVLVITHNAESQNFYNFYDARMHLENSSFTESKLAITPVGSNSIGIEEDISREAEDLVDHISQGYSEEVLKALYEQLSWRFNTLELEEEYQTEEIFIWGEITGICYLEVDSGL